MQTWKLWLSLFEGKIPSFTRPIWKFSGTTHQFVRVPRSSALCRVPLTKLGFSLPETTAVEKRIAGYLIPAGTIVIMDTQRLNKTSPCWGTDGDIFRPERWDTITPQQARYSFLGYGMGPRKCLGKNVANVIIKLFLVAIVQRFELQAGTGATQIKRDRFTCMPEEMVTFRPRV